MGFSVYVNLTNVTVLYISRREYFIAFVRHIVELEVQWLI